MKILSEDGIKVPLLLRIFNRRLKVSLNSVDIKDHFEAIRETIRSREIGIYIHFPFCKAVCLFCPYFRVIWNEKRFKAYYNALINEIRVYGENLKDLNLNVVEIHAGGGTPSIAPPYFWKEVLDVINEYFNIKDGIGVGIEANPEDFANEDKVYRFIDSGVYEVSIGGQSFNQKVLRVLGRKHSSTEIEKAIENAQNAGYKWINVDLMYMPPSIKSIIEFSLDELINIFKKDLESLIEFNIDQITYYPTLIPINSVGWKLAEKGMLRQPIEYFDKFIETALSAFENTGYEMRRVYAFSKKGYEYATVNLEMIGPLIGFGPSAWSNTGYYQYVNVHSIDEYVDSLINLKLPHILSRRISRTSALIRFIFDQLFY